MPTTGLIICSGQPNSSPRSCVEISVPNDDDALEPEKTDSSQLIRSLVIHLCSSLNTPPELIDDLVPVLITWLYARGESQGLETILSDQVFYSEDEIAAVERILPRFRQATLRGQ